MEETVYSDKRIYAWLSTETKPAKAAAEKGYIPEEGMPLLSVKLGDVLSSATVQKALRAKIPNLQCVALEDLWAYRHEEVISFINQRSLSRSVEWLDQSDQIISQIVFDADAKIRAVLLATYIDSGVFVELLLGSGQSSEYIMMALQGFILALAREYSPEERISMIAVSGAVVKILKRMLDKEFEIREEDKVHFVCLEKEDSELAESLQSPEENPVVCENIRWKVPWALNRNNQKPEDQSR